jgi:hypothetical protein
MIHKKIMMNNKSVFIGELRRAWIIFKESSFSLSLSFQCLASIGYNLYRFYILTYHGRLLLFLREMDRYGKNKYVCSDRYITVLVQVVSKYEVTMWSFELLCKTSRNIPNAKSMSSVVVPRFNSFFR